MVSGQRPSVAAGGVTLSRLLSNTSDSSVPVDTRTIRRTASPNGAPAAGCRYISTRCGFLARVSDAHLMRCIALAAWQSPVWTYLTVIDQSLGLFLDPSLLRCVSTACPGSVDLYMLLCASCCSAALTVMNRFVDTSSAYIENTRVVLI